MSDPNVSPQPNALPDASAPQFPGQEPARPAFPQHPVQPQAVQAATGVPGAPVENPVPQKPEKGPKQQRQLSKFLVISIILLAGLTIASIALVFVGDFQGKFERVFSTFVLFAIFVLLTAFDTRKEQKLNWYPPVALIANAYILGLLLLLIWMTPYDPFSLMWMIFWKSFYVIVVIRAVILCCQLLLWLGEKFPAVVTRFAFITSVLAVLAGILFTAPVGIEVFDLEIPDLYWKIATALLILTALGLSITLLLRWAYGAPAREAAGRERAEQARQYLAAQAAAPVAAAPAAQFGAAETQAQPAAAGVAPEGLLPWPTYPDGRPLPVGPDGQPDFSVLGR